MLSGSFCAIASAGFVQNLRQNMYYKIHEYSFANIDKFSTSSLVTRLATDVTNVQNAHMMTIHEFYNTYSVLDFEQIQLKLSHKNFLITCHK